jgi:hypothetical protein
MSRPKSKAPAKRVRDLGWNILSARLCFDGKMLICNGKLWIDVTPKVLKAFELRREKGKGK